MTQLLQAYTDLQQFSGAALVHDGQQTVVRSGFGLAHRELDVPATADDRFVIGSMTKAFTAALAVKLDHAGELRLDAPVLDLWPEFPDPSGGRITVRHLLTHRSGLPHWGAVDDFLMDRARRPWRPEDVVAEYAATGLRFEPGAQQAYSSIGYLAAGIVIEQVTGRAYADVLREELLRPLGMTETHIDDGDTIVPRRVADYRYNFLQARYDNAENRDPGTTFSTGGLLTRVDDLLRWSQALRGGTDGLPAAVRDTVLDLEEEGAAYGWHRGLEFVDGPVEGRVVWHGGQVAGYRSQITVDLDSGRTVILLGNLRDIDTHAVTESVWRALDGQDVPSPRQSLMKEVLAVTAADGAIAATKRFDAILASEAERYDTDPMQLLLAGVELRSDDACRRAAPLYEHWLSTYEEHRLRGAALQHATDCRLRLADVAQAEAHLAQLRNVLEPTHPNLIALEGRLDALR